MAARKNLSTLLPADAELSALGVRSFQSPIPYIIGENTPLVLVTACGEQHSWDGKAAEGLQARWFTGDIANEEQAKQVIARYEGISGADVVAGIKKALSCGTVISDDGSWIVSDEVSLPKLAGADNQYAFCAEIRRGVPVGHCYLLLSSGDRATVLSQPIITGKDGVAQTRKLFAAIAPVFAVALGRS